jgi:hypothetical protein
MNATVIYYTSNRENPTFEKKIQDDLLKKTNLPVISVSQKPINVGTNICVGDVGISGYNICRQILIGCLRATSDFVITAESDCLYSPDYFDYQPERLDIPYRNTNIYVRKYKQDCFCKKDSSLFSQVVGREFFIKRLTDLFGNAPIWNTSFKNWPKEIGKLLFTKYEYFETKYPCISFKTGRGMRKHSKTNEVKVLELPYWGKASVLRRKYEDQ